MTVQTPEQTEAVTLDINDVLKAQQAHEAAQAAKEARDNAPWISKGDYEKGDTFTFRLTEEPYVTQAEDFNTKEKRFFEDGVTPVPKIILNGVVSNATHDEDGQAKMSLSDNWLWSLIQGVQEAGGTGMPKTGDTLTYLSKGTQKKKKLHSWSVTPAGSAPAPAPVAEAPKAEVPAPAAEASAYVKVSDGQPFPTGGMNPEQIDLLVQGNVIQAAA